MCWPVNNLLCTRVIIRSYLLPFVHATPDLCHINITLSNTEDPAATPPSLPSLSLVLTSHTTSRSTVVPAPNSTYPKMRSSGEELVIMRACKERSREAETASSVRVWWWQQLRDCPKRSVHGSCRRKISTFRATRTLASASKKHCVHWVAQWTRCEHCVDNGLVEGTEVGTDSQTRYGSWALARPSASPEVVLICLW